MSKKLFINYQLNYIKQIYPTIKSQLNNNNEISIVINNEILPDVIFFFKMHYLYQFKILTCISGIDFPNNKYRFEIVYELLSIRYNTRIRIKIFACELKPVYSVSEIFSAAKWYEAEIWDMFGVFFDRHRHLMRLLTDYGFEGFPLRKNFPLSGFFEARYSERKKSVIRETIELNQEYRNFNFLSVWETQTF